MSAVTWEGKGDSRCQPAPGTISSWPRDLGTQTFSSNQGTDSIEQKCHDLKPRGVGGSKKRKEFSGPSPRSLLCPPAGPAQGTHSGRRNKGRVFFWGSRAFSTFQSTSFLWLPPPSSVSRWEYSAPGTLKWRVWPPFPGTRLMAAPACCTDSGKCFENKSHSLKVTVRIVPGQNVSKFWRSRSPSRGPKSKRV